MTNYSYDQQFFQYTNEVSAESAKVVVPLVFDALRPSSVLDLGCGCGVWLRQWLRTGAGEVVGVDGSYVSERDLVIPNDSFVAHDLKEPLALGRRFDLAQSLEVAEHLPESRSLGFVQDLCRHADVVVFGAAPPGQGGEHHINEQPHNFWRELFSAERYEPFDFIRPTVLDRVEVAPWHRYNPLLYVKSDRVAELPEAVRATHVPAGVAVRDLSPPLYRMRKAVIRQLPDWATRALAHARKGSFG